MIEGQHCFIGAKHKFYFLIWFVGICLVVQQHMEDQLKQSTTIRGQSGRQILRVQY
jgi:hypothetical protein